MKCLDYNNGMVLDVAKQLIKNSKNERLKSAFEQVKLIHAFKQPPNLLRILCNSVFITNNDNTKKGLFKCQDKRCKICKLYIQEGPSFITSNGTNWIVRCFANCNSLNTLYWLKCNFCDYTTYTGKTDNIRERTNNHITGCRHGTGSDKFDNHVHQCASTSNSGLHEPFFKLNVFMVLKDYHKLLDYELKLHCQRHDTMNC